MTRREFYASNVTVQSRRLLEGIRELANTTGGITLLGGWAVHAHVEDAYAMESQDIDVLLHTTPAWHATFAHFEREGFQWRTYRDREGFRHRDHRLLHPKLVPLAIDVFYGERVDHDLLRGLFATEWMQGFKALPDEGFLPTIDTALHDKFDTLPKRTNDKKRLKDALDAHALLYHNRHGLGVRDLWTPTIQQAAVGARSALQKLPKGSPYDPEIADLLALIQ